MEIDEEQKLLALKAAEEEAKHRPHTQPTKKLPPTRLVADDGQGDWTVAISKSVKRRIAKQGGK